MPRGRTERRTATASGPTPCSMSSTQARSCSGVRPVLSRLERSCSAAAGAGHCQLVRQGRCRSGHALSIAEAAAPERSRSMFEGAALLSCCRGGTRGGRRRRRGGTRLCHHTRRVCLPLMSAGAAAAPQPRLRCCVCCASRLPPSSPQPVGQAFSDGSAVSPSGNLVHPQALHARPAAQAHRPARARLFRASYFAHSLH